MAMSIAKTASLIMIMSKYMRFFVRHTINYDNANKIFSFHLLFVFICLFKVIYLRLIKRNNKM